jgi:hypothetical protein
MSGLGAIFAADPSELVPRMSRANRAVSVARSA